MKRFVFILLLISSGITAKNNKVFNLILMVYLPATLIKKTDVEGRELLYDNWLRTRIKAENGKEYSGVLVKYNLLEDVPYFLGKGDITMVFSSPIKEFLIENTEKLEKRTFRSGFPNIDKYTSLTFYEILVDGNVKLLKKQHKK